MATNNSINQIGPLPSFMAVNNANQTGVTGDSTDYTVTFVNEIFDTTSNFDGTSTFTATLTGKYFFSFGLYLTGITVAMTNDLIWLETTTATYRFMQSSIFPITAGGSMNLSYSAICPMTAGDTATIHVRFIGGTKVVDVIGVTAAGYRTPYFSGYMIAGI